MKINWKVVVYSILAIISLALAYLADWIFIVPAVFFIWINQKILFGAGS